MLVPSLEGNFHQNSSTHTFCGSLSLSLSLTYRADVVVHKTFHRYTVRAKRGSAQSVRDAQSGGHGPKCVGDVSVCVCMGVSMCVCVWMGVGDKSLCVCVCGREKERVSVCVCRTLMMCPAN